MQPDQKVKFGRTDLDVTAFSYGTAPIGNFMREISEEMAQTMIERSWDAGVRFFDTSPLYGHGLAELRLGHALRWKDRKDYVISTKVGRTLHPAPAGSFDSGLWVKPTPFDAKFDYSYDGAMRSFEDSLQRLALEHIDILFLHDVDRYNHGDDLPEVFDTAMSGAWKAMESLRDQGVVKAIGLGVNEWEPCYEGLQRADMDCFLLAGRYTLLDQLSLDKFLPLCEERNAAVVVGAGFNSGILATGAKPGAKYNYALASEEILSHVREIEKVCARFNTPLPAAALQFVTAHPAIPTFCAGTRITEQLEQNLNWFSHDIPAEFWSELKSLGLLREDAPVPQ